ncbi:MAG: low molecular weight phosphatase family protein [Promethearchaeota archaeon]
MRSKKIYNSNKISNVLFICYANTCRSPAAEYFAKGLKQTKYEKELINVNFDSAGWHDAFEYAQPETINYIEAKGLDISDFRPKVITNELLKKQDIIIGMERYHLVKLKKKFKDLKEELDGKLFTLKQFNGATKKADLNIPDPYKTGLENYNRILRIVEENIEKLVIKIIEINNSG